MLFIFGSALGFISVAIGAYARHNLNPYLNAKQLTALTTAIKYNQLYALLIVAIGLAIIASAKLANSKLLKISGYLFVTGTVMFSFSIYVSVWLRQTPTQDAIIAPLGGATLLLAWLMLLISSITLAKK